ncbi:MAG: ElyC/SanA/YdcF family protein [Candidatus Paceibacterota bacterium]|jgi:predicted dehydrogenase
MINKNNSVILMLGGGIKNNNGSWRTLRFGEGDNFGDSPDRLRVEAVALLCKKTPNITCIISGGKGQNLNNPDAPTTASVNAKELVELGVAKSRLILEENSNNTWQQLKESAKILNKKNIKNITLISNEFHLPRIIAFIKSDNNLKKTYIQNSKIISAESVLIDSNPKKWRSLISGIYNSDGIKKRITIEKRGIKMIEEGTYNFKPDLEDKIKTAIIGLGKISWTYEKDPLVKKRMEFPTHFSVLKNHPNFRLVAVQDKSSRVLGSFVRENGKLKEKPNVYRNWKEMIKKEKIDLLVVASNTESHFTICDEAIDLGIKSILCEKPISYSLKESESLIKKAKAKNCVLFINYFRAFNYSYNDLIHKISGGFLGRIQSFSAKYSKGIFNNGTHLIDILVRMFGEVELVRGFKNSTISYLKTDPTVDVFLAFKNGVNGYIQGLNNDFYNIYEFDIMGELGRVTIISDKSSISMSDRSGLVKGYRGLKLVKERSLISIKSGLYPVYDNIFLSLRNKEKNKCSGEDALKSLQIAHLAIKSLDKKHGI